MSKRAPINFSPFASNVLDFIDVPLLAEDGRSVFVERKGMDFVIYVERKIYFRTEDNLRASNVLNQLACRVNCRE